MTHLYIGEVYARGGQSAACRAWMRERGPREERAAAGIGFDVVWPAAAPCVRHNLQVPLKAAVDYM